MTLFDCIMRGKGWEKEWGSDAGQNKFGMTQLKWLFGIASATSYVKDKTTFLFICAHHCSNIRHLIII